MSPMHIREQPFPDEKHYNLVELQTGGCEGTHLALLDTGFECSFPAFPHIFPRNFWPCNINITNRKPARLLSRTQVCPLRGRPLRGAFTGALVQPQKGGGKVFEKPGPKNQSMATPGDPGPFGSGRVHPQLDYQWGTFRARSSRP